MDFVSQVQKHGDPNHWHDGLPPVTRGPMAITKTGHNVLSVVTIIMFVSSLAFFAFGYRLPKRKRAFHYLTGIITTIAFVSYMYMASGGSSVLIPARGKYAYREVLTGRYYDWLFTTPLLLLDIALFAGLAPFDIVMLIVFDIGMIVTGLLAAFRPDLHSRFMFFAVSCLFLVYIIAALLGRGLKVAKARHARVYSTFLYLSIYTMVLWALYPIVWVFAEGLNVITSDTEVILFGILDVLAKPVFGVILLSSHAKINVVDFTLPEWFVSPPGSHNYDPVDTEE